MWFIGLVIGGALGALAAGLGGFVVGAVLGGIAGGALGQRARDRIAKLEARVAALEQAVIARAAASAEAPAASQAERRVAAAPAAGPVTTSIAAQEPTVAPAEEVAAAPQPAPQPAAATPPPPAAAVPPQLADAAPLADREPGLWERLVGANLVAKVGVVILFIGVAFLLRYAYERVHVPIELRLIGASLVALAMLAIGWRLRETRRAYALILQGGGIGVLYLVIFGAFRLFSLLPAPAAFAMLVAVSAASAVLAVAQNSLALAAFGVAGGFLAPILASTGRGDHVMLFSYYAVLNAGIVGIAWLRAWRVLNLLGFGFSFAIGLLWGQRAYRPEWFGSTEPFLILFFLAYVAIPILFARRRVVELKDYVDATLVFGVPVAAFGFQVAMVRPYEYGAAWSALALAVFSLVLATAMFRRAGQGMRLLVESFIALCLAFGTLAVPLAFEGRLTSATWALEGAAVVWVGLRQARLLPRVFGYALQFAAGIAFLLDVGKGYGATPVLNSFYLGCLFVAAAALFCAYFVDRNRERVSEAERAMALVLLGWGALWWFGGAAHEIQRHAPAAYVPHGFLLFVAASSVGFSALGRILDWQAVRWLRLLLYPVIVAQLARDLWSGLHPFAGIGAAAWCAALVAHFWLLGRHEKERPALAEWLHAAGLWLVALLGAREVGWSIDQVVGGKRVWASISWAIVPALLLAAVTHQGIAARWPVRRFARGYVVLGGVPIALFLAAWTFYANLLNNGDPHPLPYLPLLNPLDLAVGLVFVLLARWLAALPAHGLAQWWSSAKGSVYALFGVAVFVWVNGTLLRTLHHWADISFALQPMLASRLVQASFAILWTLLALGLMVFATRRALRPAWLAGAGLMAAVVVKLFLVDLSGAGTVERIVSFIGVGVLMLVIGYLSPVPPKQEAKP
jgi:uncharacterized membrane protein